MAPQDTVEEVVAAGAAVSAENAQAAAGIVIAEAEHAAAVRVEAAEDAVEELIETNEEALAWLRQEVEAQRNRQSQTETQLMEIRGMVERLPETMRAEFLTLSNPPPPPPPPVLEEPIVPIVEPSPSEVTHAEPVPKAKHRLI